MNENFNPASNPEQIESEAYTVRVGRKEIFENLAGLGIILVVLFVAFRFFDVSEVRGYIETAGVWAPLLLVVTKAGTIIFAPLSGSPLYPLAGALFGFFKGFLLIVIGDALGAVISFYISRLFGRRVVDRFVKADTSLIAKALTLAGTVKGFLLVRIFFVSLPEIASYTAGLTRLPFLPFFVIQVGIGLIPAALLTYFGSVLALLESPLGLVGVIFAGSIAAGVGLFLFHRWAKKA